MGKVDAIGGSGRVHTSDIHSYSPLAFQGLKWKKIFKISNNREENEKDVKYNKNCEWK